jgi:hypothetical protein
MNAESQKKGSIMLTKKPLYLLGVGLLLITGFASGSYLPLDGWLYSDSYPSQNFDECKLPQYSPCQPGNTQCQEGLAKQKERGLIWQRNCLAEKAKSMIADGSYKENCILIWNKLSDQAVLNQLTPDEKAAACGCKEILEGQGDTNSDTYNQVVSSCKK